MKEKGITLITLAITIIVLIILAGVSIAALTGDNSIINEASSAKELAERKALEEQIELAIIKAEQKYNNPTIEQIIQELINNKIISNKNQVDLETGKVTTDLGYVIEGKLDDYLGIQTGENEETTQKTVADLVAGEYVNYIDKNGNTIKSIVLYDEAYNTAKNTNYGIQIITADTVKDAAGNDVTVELGNGTGSTSDSSDATHFETAKTSYNAAIVTLNNKAEEYLNTTYALDARCVGSVPDNKNSPSGMFKKDTATETDYVYLDTYGWNEVFRDTDTNYEADFNQMQSLNPKIHNLNKYYWLASRYVYPSAMGSDASVRVVGLYGMNGSMPLCLVYPDGVSESRGYEYAFRPVFTLKSDIKITGTGTEESPYTLEV